MEDCEVIVHTGGAAASSTPAELYVTLVGSDGRSQELLLSNSLTNRVPFHNGQTNIFKVRIEEVGQLQNCFIRGHQMDANHQLYLEDVIIKRWGNTTDVHVFPCNTWLYPDVEIDLQCLPEQGWGEDYPATLSVDGSPFESQSTSLPVSKTSSRSSLRSSVSSSSSFDQFGDKGSRQRFNSQKKTPDSGSSSSSLYSKTNYSSEEMATSECEPSFHCIGPGHVLGSLKQSHELKRQTLHQETTKGNSNGTVMGARLQPNAAPVCRPYSAPQLGQAGNNNYPTRTIDKQTLQTDKVSVLHSQKGSPDATGFGKTPPSNEDRQHCIDQSINKSNPPEKGINCAHEGQTKYNKGEQVEQCVASTHRDPNNASIVVPSEKPHVQEFSVGTVSKGFIIQGVENSNTSKSIIPHTKGNTENVIQENTMLWGEHSDTQDQGVVPDITCRMPLPLYNMFVGLVRDMASCSTVTESTKKGSCSEMENSLQDCHCNVGSNGAVQVNKVEASNSQGDRLPKQINNDPGIIFINGSMQADSSLNAENTLSNTSAGDLSSSETEDLEFSISSALDFHGSLNSLDVHEEMTGLEESQDGSESSMMLQNPYHRALDYIKKNNCEQLARLCYNNRTLLSCADTEGRTLLHHAAAHGNVSICQVLLKEDLGRAQLDLQDVYGKTALHYAIQMHNSTVLKFLVHEEAKYDIPDCNSQTVLNLALNLIEWHVYCEGSGDGTNPPIGWLPSI